MHTLTSSDLNIAVNSIGAELSSIKGLKTGTEYLWQANPNDWGRHAPILFPIVGKLKNDTYTYNGRSYHLPQHGFARDQEFELVEATASKLVFELSSDEKMLLIYPFDFVLSVSYELIDNAVKISYCVRNQGTNKLLYSIGAHPAFRVPVYPDTKRSDYEIVFDQQESTPIYLIENGLLSGKTEALILSNKRLRIGDSLFDKDALVFKGLASKKLSLAKVNAAPFLHFYFDAPYFGIWSKSRTSEFVCLEPWEGVADHVDHNQQLSAKSGVVELAPQGSRTFVYTVEIVE